MGLPYTQADLPQSSDLVRLTKTRMDLAALQF